MSLSLDVREPGLSLEPDEDKVTGLDSSLLPSDFTNQYIYVDGKPFNAGIGDGFKGRPYLRPIYDGVHKRLLLKCGRQVEKSSTLGNRIIGLSCLQPFHRCLYVSPTSLQTSRFSADRLTRTLRTSPPLQRYQRKIIVDNIMFKEFHNHATVTLSYAFLSADRIRGITTDTISIDEFQDIISGHVPVIEESASHSKNPSFWYAGTPKSLENPIEYFWERRSTQHEWVVPCDRHTPRHWNILGMSNIGKTGLICRKCKEPINPILGQWQITGDPEAEIAGYHISQLMVPWTDWKNLLYKMKVYPVAQFYNEVLGVSYDSGFRPLVRAQLAACCEEDVIMSEEALQDFRRKYPDAFLFMGVDWGTGDVSYTVVTISAYHPQTEKYTLLYVKKFFGEEAEPINELTIIKGLIGRHRVNAVGCDWGFGHYQNSDLMKTFGPRRVVQYQYAGNMGHVIKWDDGLKRYILNRTVAMSAVFNAIKRKEFRFPNRDQFLEEFGSDFLNIFSEYNEKTRTIMYNHPPDKPDDVFHSFLMGFMVSMIMRPRPDILNPAVKTQVS
jgi:hypothetical protein